MSNCIVRDGSCLNINNAEARAKVMIHEQQIEDQ